MIRRLAAPPVPPFAAALAGPVLIVGAVLVVLHALAFSGLLTTQHLDVLPQWLPTYCFLGKSLASGHVPAWNPYALAGTPFAADPQSGWTYLPPMLLFSALSCGRAMGWFIVLEPILAGLGIYAFLRSERASLPAATAGGLVLAMAMSGSYLSLSVPFAGTLAWSALLLAAASRFMRASSWGARFGWALATAVAWGQLGDAHMSHGLFMGTAALLVYLVVRLVAESREGRWRVAALSIGLLVVALPAVNLAVFLPRLAEIHRTSLGLGYLRLQRTAEQLEHSPPAPFVVGPASLPTWPLGLATVPGSYLGALALGLTFAGWRARRHLGLVIGFAMYGGACFLLSLHWTAERYRSAVVDTGPGQLWLHEPARFRYGGLLAVALLAGLGVQAWSEARTSFDRALMLVPGVVVFGVLPPLNHVPHGHSGFVAAMAVVALAVLALTAWRPRFLALIPAVLAVELVVNGFVGQGVGSTPSGVGVADATRYVAWAPLREPDVDAAAYIRPTAIARRLQRSQDRYISLAHEGFRRQRGYLLLQNRRYWGLLANQRSMIFRLPDAQGYGPAQLLRFWSFVRAVDPKRIKYNAAFLSPNAAPVARDLLAISWTVSSASAPVAAGPWRGRPVLTDGGWGLDGLTDVPPPASAVGQWSVARSPPDALARVTAVGFDPEHDVVLERSPGIAPGTASVPPQVQYRPAGPQEADIDVRSGAPVVVLIRIPFDTQWHATLDGQPVAVLHADYVDMAVAVPEGTHTIRLGYDDPRIGYGLLGSGLAILLLLGPALALRRRQTPARKGVAKSAGDADAGRSLVEAP